jgi:hypothetical protein
VSARYVSISEVFDELRKANLRAVVAEEKLALIEDLVVKAESQPDRRPRGKYGPTGRVTAPTVRASLLRKILGGAS